MKRPESVWIGPFLVSIIWDSGQLAKEAQSADLPSLAGLSDGTNLYIVIDERLTEPKARDTLIHEILHILWYQASIRNVPEPSEEFIVDVMALHILTLLRTNPDLVAYLVGSTDPTERTYIDDLIGLLEAGEETPEEGEG